MPGWGRWAPALLCALAFGLAGAAPAGASWERQTQIPGEAFRPQSPLLGISCPSAAMCVSVGELDRVVSSANPTGGPSAWHVVTPEGAAETDCHESWTPRCPPILLRTVRSVSCPTKSLCVAVTGEGYVYTSTDPTGGAGKWQVADVDGSERDTHLLGVSCPTVSLCVAVSGERYTAGKVLTSTDPTGGASAWNEAQLDSTLDLRGVSCAAADFCVAVAQQGRMLVSTDPTGGVSAWRELGTPGGPGNLQGVSCTTAPLCVAGNSAGNLIASIRPSEPSAWFERDGGSSVQVTAIDCLPTRQCVAVDDNGDVITTEDAADRPWSLTQLIPYADPAGKTDFPLNGIFGVSCVSRSFCAIAAADGQIFTNDDPFGELTPQRHDGGGGRRPRRPRTIISTARVRETLPKRSRTTKALFRFHANGRVRRFLCSRDGGAFRRCHSPVRYRVGLGRHLFRVRAVGLTGLRGPVATKRFKVIENIFP